MGRDKGFTLIELLIVIGLIGVFLAFALPGIIGWLPDYRLKQAANDLFSNLQWAKLGAVKANKDWAIVFDTANDQYHICSDKGVDLVWSNIGDNTIERSVELADYQSGVAFGHGAATTNATTGGGAFPGDEVSYNANVLTFNSRGTCNGGYVYLDNEDNDLAYAVGTRVSGVIRMYRWTGAQWE